MRNVKLLNDRIARGNSVHRTRYWLVSTVVLTLLGMASLSPVEAQPVSTNSRQLITEASNLLEQGKTLFAGGRLAEAAKTWEQAAQRYKSQGNHWEQARSLGLLSLAYFNLGEWKKAERSITQSLNLLQPSATLNHEGKTILAQSLNSQGNIQLALGQTEAAFDTWKQAAIAYQSIGDVTGKLGTQLNQARTLQSLGQYRRSQALLEQALAHLQAQPDTAIKATGLRMLGVALQALGDLTQSKERLEQSLAITQQLQTTNPIFVRETSATLVSLGNTLTALQQTDAALERYQQAADVATNPLTRTEALLNQLHLLVDNQQWQKAQALIPKIRSNLANLPPSRAAIYARVNFSQSLMQMKHGESGQGGQGSEFTPISQQTSSPLTTPHSPLPNSQEIAQLLATAVQHARGLHDRRAEAYALGQLGHLYERSDQWREAKDLTEQATLIAQGINAPDITAQWQWQLGRLFKHQGKTQEAIATYTSAVDTLQSLRQELVALNSDLQFSFTESAEPVYRELVGLLLEPSSRTNGEIPQENLKKARQVIEALQLAELENFFREACLRAKPQQIDQIDKKTAVVYPIILPDRLAVIVSGPGQPLFYHETRLPQAEIEKTIDQLQLYLNPHFFDKERLRVSQKLYDWLIRPAEDKLVQENIKTLVFVLDGTLRSVPMAALHDGKQYLIEKYSIALTPGLQLLEPRSLKPEQLKALAAGLSESRQGFSALPAVKDEVNKIASEVPSSILLNEDFTSNQLRAKINSVAFPVVHLATHGQFSSKADETFLVTWDSRINVKELAELLRTRERDTTNPIELLVLSACQTAAGDKRAALGIAGFAVRSGARSTLATLWQVNDASTAQLMIKFYASLTQKAGITKAEALRAAQLELLKHPQYRHPFYWAPFVLVGNWL